MKFRYNMVLFIGCCVLLVTSLFGSAQSSPILETDELKYRVAIGDSATYEYTKVKFSDDAVQSLRILSSIDENGMPFNITLHQGLRFTIIVTNITKISSPLSGDIFNKVFTKIDYGGKVTLESGINLFLSPSTDNVSYWEEQIRDNSDPNVTIAFDKPIYTVRASFVRLLLIIQLDIHSGWVTFFSQQTFDTDGNLTSHTEITKVTGGQASGLEIPFVNINIPFFVIGVLVVVPVAFAGGILLAKLLKR